MNITEEKIHFHLTLNNRWLAVAALTLALGFGSASSAAPETATMGGTDASSDASDAALVRSLPGFENGYADVNGTQLHYVTGGKGQPLVLLPGWPETWWEFHLLRFE